MKTYKSLKAKLLRSSLLLLSLAWVVTLIAGYILTEKTLNQQLDTQLKEVAESLSDQIETSETTIEITGHEGPTLREGKTIEFQIFRNDKMTSYSGHAPKEVLSNLEGFSQNEIEQKMWRVFSGQFHNSRILVGQDMGIRRSLIQGMILSSLWPMAVALPLIALILWLTVTVSLKPLSVLALAIKERSPKQLSKIDLGEVPSEVVPVVQSLNDLLDVVEKAFEREKQFTDNAAHELRTPLAGIKAQVEAALRTQNEHEKSEGLVLINHGIDRASRMVNQLLTLARLEPKELQILFSQVNLQSLATQVIARLTPQALTKKIDLGLITNTEATAIGNPQFLDVLITNLVDNAIRYSPQSSKIDLSLQNNNSNSILTIVDQGPGIPTKDRERVFERFVRLGGTQTEGIGVGLAIVKRIADLHNIQIELGMPKGHTGLKVMLTFPKAKPFES
jgi:two-component system sensor histidine kinase QseC